MSKPRDPFIPDGVLFDEADRDLIAPYRWHVGSGGYVWTSVNRKPMSMHRLLLGFPQGEVDHRNGVKIDNRRTNLRVVTTSENQHNRHRPNRNGSTGFRNVSYRKDVGLYHARLSVRGAVVRLGYFKTAEAASHAVENYRRDHHL